MTSQESGDEGKTELQEMFNESIIIETIKKESTGLDMQCKARTL